MNLMEKTAFKEIFKKSIDFCDVVLYNRSITCLKELCFKKFLREIYDNLFVILIIS